PLSLHDALPISGKCTHARPASNRACRNSAGSTVVRSNLDTSLATSSRTSTIATPLYSSLDLPWFISCRTPVYASRQTRGRPKYGRQSVQWPYVEALRRPYWLRDSRAKRVSNWPSCIPMPAMGLRPAEEQFPTCETRILQSAQSNSAVPDSRHHLP